MNKPFTYTMFGLKVTIWPVLHGRRPGRPGGKEKEVNG